MVNKYQYEKLVWLDLESPTDEELREVMDEYNLSPLLAEELRIPSPKPKVDLYKNLILLILHFPAYMDSHVSEFNQEVDFIIGRDFLITVRYDAIETIHKFSKEFEVNAILEKHDFDNSPGHLFFHLISKLYQTLEHELDFIAGALDEVEARIFQGHEKEVVIEISELSRDLLNFKQAMGGHREVLSSFEVASRGFFGASFSYPVKSIIAQYYRIYRIINDNKESLIELRQTNDSLLSTKQNEVMKFLTIMAFITFPLSLFASIFGMNTDYLPIVGMKNDFWIVMSVMFTITVIFFTFFKYKKWL